MHYIIITNIAFLRYNAPDQIILAAHQIILNTLATDVHLKNFYDHHRDAIAFRTVFLNNIDCDVVVALTLA